MAQTTTIYGQAFITDDALVQDMIFLIDLGGGKVQKSENTVEIVSDIWEDLKSTTGEAKTDGKGFWYWEVTQTNMQETDKTVTVKYPCPKPTPSTFDNDLEIKTGDSDWTKYWKEKMTTALNSPYNSTNALQQKEVTLKGTKYIDQNGDLVVIDDVQYTRTDLGDIQNLLVNLY